MLYPKCLYKSRDITTVAKDQHQHVTLAMAGWKDIWTDAKPNDLIEIKSDMLGKVEVEIKDKEAEVGKLETQKELLKKDLEKVIDGNRKDNTSGSTETIERKAVKRSPSKRRAS